MITICRYIYQSIYYRTNNGSNSKSKSNFHWLKSDIDIKSVEPKSKFKPPLVLSKVPNKSVKRRWLITKPKVDSSVESLNFKMDLPEIQRDQSHRKLK